LTNEKETFNPRLESVRGIAALGVAFTHSQIVFNLTSRDYEALGPLRNWVFIGLPSGGSVIVFFVLSGYVLRLAIEREQSAFRFIVRRLFRIFPALWVAVTAMFLALLFVAPQLPKDQFHPAFQSWFLNLPTWNDYWLNLLLLKNNIDQVTWSLSPELIWSLALPVCAWLHFRANTVWRLVALLVLAWVGYSSYRSYIQFGAAFYAGFFVPKEILIPRLTRATAAAALSVAGWVLLCYGNITLVAYTPSMRLWCAASAVLVVSGVSTSGRYMVLLETAPLRFLGRLSYSFYLLHPPTLFCFAAIAAYWPVIRPINMLGSLSFGCASIILAIAVSAICYRFVELPFIAIGRRLVFAQKSSAQLDETARA